jgi:hypothetical protein
VVRFSLRHGYFEGALILLLARIASCIGDIVGVIVIGGIDGVLPGVSDLLLRVSLCIGDITLPFGLCIGHVLLHFRG